MERLLAKTRHLTATHPPGWFLNTAAMLLGLLSLQLQGQEATQDTLPPRDNVIAEPNDLGYYQVDRGDQTGAITKVRMHQGAVLTFDQLLQGGAPGLTAIQTSGQPAAPLNLQVRGLHTLSAGSQPLYVIDGFPLYNRNDWVNGGLANGPPINGLAFLDPADIASIDVLRGVGATGLYGARASNGVVIIRTKRGEPGDRMIGLNSEVGFQTPIEQYKLANGSQYLSFVNQAFNNAGLNPPFGASAIGGTDWSRSIFRDSPLSQSHRLIFRGGSKAFRFALSGTYRDVHGIVLGSDLQRYSLHANIDADVSKKMTINNSLNFSRINARTISTDQSGVGANIGVVGSSYLFNPLLPERDQNGALIPFNFEVNADGSVSSLLQNDHPVRNPVALATAWDSEVATSRISDFLGWNYSLSKRFAIVGGFGLDVIFNDEATFLPGALEFNVPLGGIGTSSKLQSYQWVQQYFVKYETLPSSKHQLSLMGGYSAEGFRRELLTGQASGFENEALRYFSLAVGKNKSVGSDVIQWGLESFLGKATYRWDKKYSVQFAARADASSRFGNKFEFFPTFSGVWHITEEPFIKSQKILSQLSLRLGYGLTGNQEIPPYSSLTFLDELTSVRQGSMVNGIGPSRIGNENLEVEKTTKFDVGVRVGLFENRWQIEADFYRYQTKNAMLLVPLAGVGSSVGNLQNGAGLENNGFELSLQAIPLDGSFTWNSLLHLGFNKNEITALPQELNSLTIGVSIADVDDWGILQVGQSVGAFYGYQTNGLATAGENAPSFAGQNLDAGDQKYLDANGDGIINRLDKAIIGKSQADYNLGFHNQLKFRQFELNIYLHGLLGRDVANLNFINLQDPTGRSNVLSSFAVGGTDQVVPRRSAVKVVFSDALLQDGSFLRLQNITLGYQLPKGVLAKLPVSKCQIYLAADNIFTLAGYSGIDPDVSHFGQDPLLQGIDFDSYPKAKAWRTGIKMEFQ